ncbi:hypothetical protein S83_047573, partial [Arachis hypogaea]
EALIVANEERKKLKAEAVQIKAQERKNAQQEFRETLMRFSFSSSPLYEFCCAHQMFDGLLLKERAEKLENWRMKVQNHGEMMVEKKELLRRQSSMWIDEANLETQYWNPSFPFAESLILLDLLWLGL